MEEKSTGKGNKPKTFCSDPRPCFARLPDRRCDILEESYDRENKKCPFCKKRRDDVVRNRR